MVSSSPLSVLRKYYVDVLNYLLNLGIYITYLYRMVYGFQRWALSLWLPLTHSRLTWVMASALGTIIVTSSLHTHSHIIWFTASALGTVSMASMLMYTHHIDMI